MIAKFELVVRNARAVFTVEPKFNGGYEYSQTSGKMSLRFWNRGTLTNEEVDAVNHWFEKMEENQWRSFIFDIFPEKDKVHNFKIEYRIVDYIKAHIRMDKFVKDLECYPDASYILKLILESSINKFRSFDYHRDFNNDLKLVCNNILNEWRDTKTMDSPKVLKDCCKKITLDASLRLLDTFHPKKVTKTIIVEEEDYSEVREFLSNNN